MNYHAFTIDSFTMMYEGARGALAADDTLSELGEVPGFRVRETPDWKLRFDLETEAISQKLGRLKQQPAGSPPEVYSCWIRQAATSVRTT
jgi:hypothetical protein